MNLLIALGAPALAPGQADFARIHISTVKDSLRSIHLKLDHCPTSMQLDKFAAIDGPGEAGATEMHERMIAVATEQSHRIPA